MRSSRAEALLGSAPDEQITAALAEGRLTRAADLIAHHGERVLLDSGTRELSAWFGALPESELMKSPRLLATLAWVRVYEGRYQDARHRLSQAERALTQLELAELTARRAESDDGPPAESSDDDDVVELVPHAELKQSLAALNHHLQAVAEGGRLPDDVSEMMIPASTDHPLWRAGALLILGRCRLLAGQLGAARDDLEAAHLLASTSRGRRAQRTAAEATVLLGRIAEARGALDEANGRYREVLAMTEPTVAPHVATAQIGLANIALARLELAEARAALAALSACTDAAPEGSLDPVRIIFDGNLVSAWIHALDGEYDRARQVLDATDKALAHHQFRWPLDLLGVERARLSLFRREESAARRWLQQHVMREGGGLRRPGRPFDALAAVTSAHVLLAQHQPAQALAQANAVLAYAEETQSRRFALDALIATALAHFASDARESARSALTAALEAAEPAGLALPFAVRGLDKLVDELGLDHPLLKRALSAMPSAEAPARERPSTRSAAPAGPIETAQVAATDATAAPSQAAPIDVAAAPTTAPTAVPAPGVETTDS